MTDHGWHNFYLAYNFVGKIPEAVTATLDYPSGSGAEDNTFCHIRFPGANALLNLTWKSSFRKNYALICGDKAVVEILDDVVVLEDGTGRKEFNTGDKLTKGSAHPTWMAPLLDDFYAEVVSGEGKNRNLLESEICALLLECGYRSATTGCAVEIPKPRTKS
jgi:predicted dehydrogenase